VLEAAEIPYSVLQNYQEIAEDRQMWSNGVFMEMQHPVHGPVTVVSSPISVGERPKDEPRPAPGYGEHTREILGALGYSAKQIEALIDSGTALAASAS
jgi:crotonobetainyl-CoA:carnitine CoA-transferase CaiB-like acyl-CoA transferase